jgi:hypothetical protein
MIEDHSGQSQAMKTLLYTIDRIEGRFAVLAPDEGPPIEVARRELPKGAREGSVLRVAMDGQGQPDWPTAVIDRGEEKRRSDKAEKTLDEMKKTDPGGDITL